MLFAALPTRGALEATVGERQSAVTLVAHFVEFAVLGVLVALALLAGSPRRSVREALLGAAAVGVVFALGTELLQIALPWRSFEVRDLVVDLLGLVLGLVLVSRRCGGARGGRGRHA